MHEAGIETVDEGSVGGFRARRIGDKYLITNGVGDWTFLDAEALKGFVEGSLDESSPAWNELKDKGFIKSGLDQAAAAERYRARKGFLFAGPWRHVLVLSTVGPGETEATTMSTELAERALDTAFMSTNPRLRVELRSSDFAADRELLAHAIEYARERNKLAQKGLEFGFECAASALAGESMTSLAADGVRITARVGLSDITEDAEATRAAIAAIEAAYDEAGLERDSHHLTLAVMPSVAAESGAAATVAGFAAEAGIRTIFVEAPGPAVDDPAVIDAWLAFYGELLDALLAKPGGPRERWAFNLATKALAGIHPADDLIRSPSNDGIGQFVFGPEGRIYTSEDGLKLGVAGDPIFQIGDLAFTGYRDLVAHPTVQTLIVSTILEGQPGCTDCAYAPFCGQSPAHNYVSQGSLHGRMGDGAWCRRQKGLQDRIFGILSEADSEASEVLGSWAAAPAEK